MNDFFPFPHKEVIGRRQPCSLCDCERGNLVGRVNYFGLGEYDMAQCPECGLVSIDPIPEGQIIEEGCTRLYAIQQSQEPRQKVLRGFAKSYRRGARFARRHLHSLKGADPTAVLEIGAGDGYFSAGIAAELPQAKVTYVDIVEDLIHFYREHHVAEAVHGEFKQGLFPRETFDIVIFRDLLEHVRDPVALLGEANVVLRKSGRIFFLTPNGREDFWLINQRFIKTGQASVLLLNHFHYFLPETLERMLGHCGFRRDVGFKYGLKGFRRGLGHQQLDAFGTETVPEVVDAHLAAPVSHWWKHRPEEVTARPLSNLGWLSRLYSDFVDKEAQTTDYFAPQGHEFFVLASKASQSLCEDAKERSPREGETE